MLDNQDLIKTLEDTKKKAKDISEKLEIMKTTATELEKTREGSATCNDFYLQYSAIVLLQNEEQFFSSFYQVWHLLTPCINTP